MSTAVITSIVAPLLVFLAAVFGVWMKRRTERQAAIDQKAKEEADRKAAAESERLRLEAERIKVQFDQMQEALTSNREEMRAQAKDLSEAREEIGKLWSQITRLRRENDAQKSHIDDVHRWDDSGRHGAMPKRIPVTNG